MVHIVTGAHLRGATVTAPVMSDDAIAFGKKKQHLRVPIVGRQRPAMVEHDGLCVLRAPVLIEYFDAIGGFHGLHILVSTSRSSTLESNSGYAVIAILLS